MNEMFVIFLLLLFFSGNAFCFWLGSKVALKEPLYEKPGEQEIVTPQEDVEYEDIVEQPEIE